jgi:hypothetical protein
VDEAPKPVRIQGSLDHSRATFNLVAIVAVLIALAVLKPWAGSAATGPGDVATDTAVPAEAGTSAAAAVEPPPTADPNAMTCLTDPSLHVVTVERSPGNVVRTWVVAPPGNGTDPLDPDIPRLELFSEHLVGLGICSPRPREDPAASGAPAGPDVVGRDVQLIDVQAIVDSASGPVATDLGRGRVLVEARPGSGETTVYSGPQRPVGPAGLWTPGSYAVAFRFAYDPRVAVRWLRIDVHGPGHGG